MKRIIAFIKLIGIIFVSIMFIGTVMIIVILAGYKFSWKKYIDKKQVIEFSELINSSDKLPENFYYIYDKIYPSKRKTTIWETYTIGQLLYSLNLKDRTEIISPTRTLSGMAYYSFVTNIKPSRPTNYPVYFSIGVDENTTPQKCFDYYMSIYDFGDMIIGIRNMSIKMYDKKLEKLTDDEIIEIIAFMNVPILRIDFEYDRLMDEKNKLKLRIE